MILRKSIILSFEWITDLFGAFERVIKSRNIRKKYDPGALCSLSNDVSNCSINDSCFPLLLLTDKIIWNCLFNFCTHFAGTMVLYSSYVKAGNETVSVDLESISNEVHNKQKTVD